MRMRRVLAIGLLIAPYFFQVVAAQEVNTQIVGDSISHPLTSAPADVERGRAIVTSRHVGLCLLCHNGPFPEEPFQGNLAPDLGLSVATMNAGQLRARLVNPAHFNPNTIMPAYYQTAGLTQVAPKFVGQTILSAQEIEDVIAFLVTLNNQTK
ncbi:sulfur oxidation c-type cytochrome SoxX [Polynucleobacter sphagniphilus]|uniref:Sulfur-oxidizing protein SoxX n=1 Tax=Polynucleobacter sphagniphilus TaxID=1743169 RepID=A0AA43S5E3_9BURK|nr:sulfur oxidation c-type cytochrome SoxX [Polynucleobacter sphagniphilus]MDF9788157.1 sulfur-oxidizing protein SoxX [Polynucleobacter sphagniphilus]MDH6154901.1 sulfur-oxidizing protein SoxX [Polynucleobacter sphagniphilus]MDH6242309.1 sulfur-oxidizing protein SoxX [Polynucleobacter sphagniphilus]MDH6300585.1 sulfur-oxidizing protein SoxX [Polynucleobacter sphagniphilus]MDH6302392.1 sulfur-oxidizing protein SoxX [Polynucleobacter sphagniphilus]